uniref:Hydroxylysine kinase n=2 Tax=Monodelphis domestica TaxID=13616 RepID=A0A5F8GJY9_MONDO
MPQIFSLRTNWNAIFGACPVENALCSFGHAELLLAALVSCMMSFRDVCLSLVLCLPPTTPWGWRRWFLTLFPLNDPGSLRSRRGSSSCKETAQKDQNETAEDQSLSAAMPGPEHQPSQALTKPAFSEPQACALVESMFGLKVAKIQPLPSYDDQNFHVHVPRAPSATGGLSEYVLKVNNSESSKNADLVEVQSCAMMFLKAEGFPTATVHPTKGGNLASLMSIDSGSNTQSYLVRLFTYLPGRPIAQVPVTTKLLYEVGKLAAQMDRTLEKFHHPKISSLQRGDFIWNLRNVPLLEKYSSALGQTPNREMVDQVLKRFKDEIVPKLSSFRECINHGDLNGYNLLVEPSSEASGDAEYRVSGVLDFEDMSRGCYVFELAIAIMYMMIESEGNLAAGGHVLAGFESVVPLTAEERSALFLLVSGRFAQSLVMSAYTCQLYPENKDYLTITAKTGWKHLQKLLDAGQKAVEEIWFETSKSYTQP